MISRITQFSCRLLLLLKEKTKKAVILSHFSNLKFLFITANVLKSARFDLWKIWNSLLLVSLGLQCSQIFTNQNA